MKIAIVYYSNTGNTEKVVKALKEKLAGNKHETCTVKLPVENKSDGKRTLSHVPDLPMCDKIILASHVEAFSLEPVMKEYLKRTEDMEGKDVVCYLSQGLPKSWMGAKGSLKSMKKLAEQKGANVLYTKSVSFSDKINTDHDISNAVGEISMLF